MASATMLCTLLRSKVDAAVTVQAHLPAANLQVLDLTLPWCGVQLHWQVLRDLARPDLAPDLIFDSKEFLPLCSAGSSSTTAASNGTIPALQREAQQLLSGWRASDATAEAERVTALVALLLRLFFEHQKQRLTALGDERLAFELGMLEDTGCSQLMLTDEKDPSARRACFSIPIRDLDVSCAAPLLNYHAQQQQKQQRQGEQQQQRQAAPTASRPGPATTTSSPPLAIRRTPTDTDPASLIGSTESSAADSADDKSGSGGDFVLHVAFRTGPHSTHTTPTLVLQAPEWFTAALPPLPLPSWNPQAPLLEFVPLVRERLQQHLEQYCGAAAGKFQIFEHLSTLFGPPLELRMASLPSNTSAAATGNAAPSYSTIAGSGSGLGGSGSGALVGSGGAGLSVAAFHVLHDQLPLLLFVEVLPRFPEEQPALTLQSVRRTGAEGAITWRNYPWSPRWPVEEMAARIFNFVKQQAAVAGVKMATGS